MISFNFYEPTEIIFGPGKLSELGGATAPIANKVLLVIDPILPKVMPAKVELAKASLSAAGVEVVQFDGVVPNPTLDKVQAGAEIARKEKVEAILGFGGGSAIDTAKAIAVAATHSGTAMDYLYFSDTQPTKDTLPIITVTTTSGTGTQVTKVSVLTDSSREFKSALCHPNIFPTLSIVDPELMLTLPKGATAAPGFDVFTHSFESFINVNASPFTDLMALESIRLVVDNLPKAVADGSNLDARINMAWADTLAGVCIANAGTTLPHAMGQPISGHFPKVSHGQSLAVIYPAFLGYTAPAAEAKFAVVARIFNADLVEVSDSEAAMALKTEVVEFLKSIDLYNTLEDFDITPGDIDPILKHCMEFPDVTVNPIVPDEDKVRELYMSCFAAVEA